MIRVLYRSGAGHVSVDPPATDWHTALHDPKGLLWVDFNAAPLVEVEPLLRDTFGFHVLAIDDALRQTHVPKIDDWATTSTPWSTALYVTSSHSPWRHTSSIFFSV